MIYSGKTLAFLVKDSIKFSANEVANYMSENGAKVITIRKKYIKVAPNTLNYPGILTKFILNKIQKTKDAEFIKDATSFINEKTIDIFFDTSDSKENGTIIEFQ